MTQNNISLDDKFTITKGRIFISGNQALVRLPIIQKQLDAKKGLNTAGFISGYRGSPLGNYDAALWKAKDQLAAHEIIFQPGVNEDLAATAVWGTQQIDSLPNPTVDGVFAIWYGKGPGVDRSGDPIKHGNMSGTHKNGGVLLIYGDDHPGKSSSIAHQSEQALIANSVPSLYPANVEEIIEFGLLGWAMSRFTGLWVGLKTVNETVEQTATCDIDLDGIEPNYPEDPMYPAEGVHHRPRQFTPLLDESLVTRYKLPLVHQFIRKNNIDKCPIQAATKKLGIVTAGKAYLDVLEALAELGLDNQAAEAIGISVYKAGCIWPLEPTGLKTFAQGHEELLFVEEKKSLLEDQAAKILYAQIERPRIIGKQGTEGETLLPSDIQLEPALIARIIANRLEALNIANPSVQRKLAELPCLHTTSDGAAKPLISRTPYFCSGCPHNTSTKIPDGSVASAGIGCHAMAVYSQPDILIFSQMGGEGATWYGLSKFTKTPHIFQNLGDGTYYHSGLLAIRGAVAAGVNITYKILFNDVVAMTGGQPVDGPLSVADITYQVLHEGVKKCVVVTDSPQSYKKSSRLAKGVRVYHRDQLDKVQKELREIPGCTVLIYEQTCATEKRRRRKRGLLIDPPKRAYINDAVCEGCGDCSVQANCVSIQPKQTVLGRKRQIDQSSCNKDFSCIKGFCPSFITVHGGQLKKPAEAQIDEYIFDAIPKTSLIPLNKNNYSIMVSGIGGSGVITVSSVLGMAAHLEGKACSIYDMTGLSQKNGAVYSHLRIANKTSSIRASRIGAGQADLSLGFDMVAALEKDAAQSLSFGRTQFIGNSSITPTASFQKNPNLVTNSQEFIQQAEHIVGPENTYFVDATQIGLQILGDTIAANMFMVGYAAQLGLLPVGTNAIEKAIELNGVAIPFNLKALKLGRLWAWKPEALKEFLNVSQESEPNTNTQTLEEIINHRTQLLTDYQDQAYAERYQALIHTVIHAEHNIVTFDHQNKLSKAVAHNFAKLMAYKDEYEVARLYSDPLFLEKLNAQFEGDFKIKFHLAPPLLSPKHPVTGKPTKREFGGWVMPVFKMLAKMKGLRGSPFDLFGYTHERKTERQLIDEYEQRILSLVTTLSENNYRIAVKVANLPDEIRGFGHVKEENLKRVKEEEASLLKQYKQTSACEFIELRHVS